MHSKMHFSSIPVSSIPRTPLPLPPRGARVTDTKLRKDDHHEVIGLTTATSIWISAVIGIGKIPAKCCSFSAVSAPIFAKKYAFCSIFQNLPDYLAAIVEMWQNFATIATFAKFC